MKFLNCLTLLMFVVLLTGSLLVVSGQEKMPIAETTEQQDRPRLLEALDLTPDQIQQIRRINQENRPQLREANRRFREANRNLDLAIYSDRADEAEIQTQVKEVYATHSEFIKLRTQIEFAVRKVLTPEQLVIFREIREQSPSKKNNLPFLRNNRRMNNSAAPLKNRLRRNRPIN